MGGRRCWGCAIAQETLLKHGYTAGSLAALGKGGEEMARGWALSDLASHIGDAQEQLLLAELVEAHC
jgi:hypothetical protein